MATDDGAQEHELLEEARKDILRRIADRGGINRSNTTTPEGVRALAEAYAWLVSPAQPHSGSMKVG